MDVYRVREWGYLLTNHSILFHFCSTYRRIFSVQNSTSPYVNSIRLSHKITIQSVLEYGTNFTRVGFKNTLCCLPQHCAAVHVLEG